MRTMDLLASALYLTVLPNSSVGQEITAELQKKYTQVDEEWPEEYYAELSDYYKRVLEGALQLGTKAS